MQPAAEDAARGRRWRLAALSAVVLLGHLWLADGVLPSRLGDGEAERAIKRFDVSFVRELQQTAPPAAPPVPRAAARPRRVAPVAAALAASAAAEAVVAEADPVPAGDAPASAPAGSAPQVMAAAPQIGASAPEAAASAALAQGPAAAASGPAAAFEWPPSTRLSYTLVGNYRGPVEGRAQVEWLRSGTRYQVTLEASVGPAIAPLMTRRASSEGEITAEGLSPRRYEEETRVVMRDPRRLSIALDTDRVRLANGHELPRPPGVQDTASQFVHLTWLFTTQPQLLTRGQRIELPLALPRHVLPWTYEVLDTVTLQTPVGTVPAVHVKPHRPPTPDRPSSRDLTAELWVAPTLQYLPVRIVVRQDDDTWIDMLIERLPQQ